MDYFDILLFEFNIQKLFNKLNLKIHLIDEFKYVRVSPKTKFLPATSGGVSNDRI